jgi:hypothetical protein
VCETRKSRFRFTGWVTMRRYGSSAMGQLDSQLVHSPTEVIARVRVVALQVAYLKGKL